MAAHCLEIEKALGITKGKPMSVDDADKQHGREQLQGLAGVEAENLLFGGFSAVVAPEHRQIRVALGIFALADYALENNAFIFSGFKTFHTLREVGLSLVTDKGDIKPFETFRRDVEAVNTVASASSSKSFSYNEPRAALNARYERRSPTESASRRAGLSRKNGRAVF